MTKAEKKPFEVEGGGTVEYDSHLKGFVLDYEGEVIRLKAKTVESAEKEANEIIAGWE